MWENSWDMFVNHSWATVFLNEPNSNKLFNSIEAQIRVWFFFDKWYTSTLGFKFSSGHLQPYPMLSWKWDQEEIYTSVDSNPELPYQWQYPCIFHIFHLQGLNYPGSFDSDDMNNYKKETKTILCHCTYHTAYNNKTWRNVEIISSSKLDKFKYKNTSEAVNKIWKSYHYSYIWHFINHKPYHPTQHIKIATSRCLNKS